MHRLERLINLVAALLESGRPLSAEELRQRLPGYPEDLGAFRRAFERDKESLRDLGVPVSVEPIDPAHPGIVGYRVPKEDYYLPDLALADDELAALHLAASVVRFGDSDNGDGLAALWKLGGADSPVDAPSHGSGAGGSVARGWAGADDARPASATLASLPAPAGLPALFSAIGARRPVGFDYRGQSRTVDPYRLSFRNGQWYLLGRDHGRDEQRWFRLDRFESDVAPKESSPFERPVAMAEPLAPWELGGHDAVVARLLVDADQAAWAIRDVGEASVQERRSDGSVVLEVRVTNREAFRTFVLGFLDHAEILGPADLRAEMMTWLQDQCRS